MNRGVLEHHSCGQRQPRVTRPGGQLHREDAVTAEAEEVVVASDLGHVEHIGQHRGEHAFGFGAGGLCGP